MRNFTYQSVVLFVATLLAGCSGAPSESQMNEALLSQIKQEQAALERFAGKGALAMTRGMTPEITGLHKIGCKEDGEKAYRCDVEIEAKQGGKSAMKPANLRFVKASSGWAVSK